MSKQAIVVVFLVLGSVSGCTFNTDCPTSTPICSNGQCSSQRIVESSKNLPTNFNNIDRNVWTKYVRSIIPVIGKRDTEPAAMFEAAYFLENAIYPNQRPAGPPGMINDMLGKLPTVMSVWPACPGAFMHPTVTDRSYEQSSGGGGVQNTLVSEDWVLQYPKCTGSLAVKCSAIPQGAKCNNCGWKAAAGQISGCLATLAHEFGHTLAGFNARRNPAFYSQQQRLFASSNVGEGPAWAASDWFMGPNPESNTPRSAMGANARQWFTDVLKFDPNTPWRYVLKPQRCPNKPITAACDDAATRTYRVPLDCETRFRPSSSCETFPKLLADASYAGKVAVFSSSDCSGSDYVITSKSRDTCGWTLPQSGQQANIGANSVLVPPGFKLKSWDSCLLTYNYANPSGKVFTNSKSCPVCVQTRPGSVAFLSPTNPTDATWRQRNTDVLVPPTITEIGGRPPTACPSTKFPKPVADLSFAGKVVVFGSADCSGTNFVATDKSRDTCGWKLPGGQDGNLGANSVLIPPGYKVKSWSSCLLMYNYANPSGKVFTNTGPCPMCVQTRPASVAFFSPTNPTDATWRQRSADVLVPPAVTTASGSSCPGIPTLTTAESVSIPNSGDTLSPKVLALTIAGIAVAFVVGIVVGAVIVRFRRAAHTQVPGSDAF